MKDLERGYDPTDVKSIVEYSHKLVGKTLREVTDAPELADPHRRRGSFGNAVEEYFFKYPINSDSAPDFADAGLEVKATPVKEVRHGKKRELVAKERLVLGKIDYNAVVNETFETSHVMKKCSDMLLISYLYEPDKNPVDYVVEAVAEWGIPQKDLPQVRADWETVVNKVRAGHAEDISGSDTMYLEACTKSAKGSDRTSQPFSEAPAKPRAWALKASYMTAVQRKIIDGMQEIPRSEAEKDLDLLTLVKKRFDPYVGMTAEELQDRFGLSHSKSVTARITNCILGVRDNGEIEEFSLPRRASNLRPLGSSATALPRRPCRFPPSTTSSCLSVTSGAQTSTATCSRSISSLSSGRTKRRRTCTAWRRSCSGRCRMPTLRRPATATSRCGQTSGRAGRRTR